MDMIGRIYYLSTISISTIYLLSTIYSIMEWVVKMSELPLPQTSTRGWLICVVLLCALLLFCLFSVLLCIMCCMLFVYRLSKLPLPTPSTRGSLFWVSLFCLRPVLCCVLFLKKITHFSSQSLNPCFRCPFHFLALKMIEVKHWGVELLWKCIHALS